MRVNGRNTVHATTLFELTIALSLIGSIGLAIFSMLNVGLILGAKNTAVNTAHQQARVAMLGVGPGPSFVRFAARSLCDVNSVPLVNPPPNTPAPGISFQLWAGAVLIKLSETPPSERQSFSDSSLRGTDALSPQVGERLINRNA